MRPVVFAGLMLAAGQVLGQGQKEESLLVVDLKTDAYWVEQMLDQAAFCGTYRTPETTRAREVLADMKRVLTLNGYAAYEVPAQPGAPCTKAEKDGIDLAVEKTTLWSARFKSLAAKEAQR